MGADICCCRNNALKASLLDDDALNNECDNLSEDSSHSDASLQEEEPVKTYKQWIELVFWTFAGSTQNSDGNLYMTMQELQNFINIVHLQDEVTTDKVIQCLGKTQSGWLNALPQLAVNEFVEYFCDEHVNPQCHRIQDAIEGESNWLLLQNALKIFDVVDVDKVEYIHNPVMFLILFYMKCYW